MRREERSEAGSEKKERKEEERWTEVRREK